MLIFPGTLNSPAGLLLILGGAMTLIASLLMAVDRFRDAGGPPTDESEGHGNPAPVNAPNRPRSFIFIGVFAFPLSFGGFRGGGPRRRTLGVLYLAGLLVALSGVLLLLQR